MSNEHEEGFDLEHTDDIDDVAEVARDENQMALFFVADNRRGSKTQYDATLLYGTTRVREEIQEVGSDTGDHDGIDDYPYKQGLWIWTGALVWNNGPDNGPTWEGEFIEPTKEHYIKLGIQG